MHIRQKLLIPKLFDMFTHHSYYLFVSITSFEKKVVPSAATREDEVYFDCSSLFSVVPKKTHGFNLQVNSKI